MGHQGRHGGRRSPEGRGAHRPQAPPSELTGLAWIAQWIVAAIATIGMRRREVRRHRIVTPIDRVSIATAVSWFITFGIVVGWILSGVPIWAAFKAIRSPKLGVFPEVAVRDYPELQRLL